MFNMTGLCERCGKPVGRLPATSIIPMGGTRAYPALDPVIYHIHYDMVKATIRCQD